MEGRRDFSADPATNPIPSPIRRSNCSREMVAVQSAEGRYPTEMTRAREAFENLAFAVQRVEQSCQYPLAAMAPAPGGTARSPPATAS